jgi:hypothetical protein
MNYAILREELIADPLGRSYITMSDQECADDLNAIYRTRNRTSMTATEVFNTADPTEWTTLTDTEQRKIWDVLHMGDGLDPFGNEATIFINVFGAGSNTIQSLADARVEDVSRGTEIGFGFVRATDVHKARA